MSPRQMLVLAAALLAASAWPRAADAVPDCADLYAAMVCCVEPTIDHATQAAAGCGPSREVSTRCYARDGVSCALPSGSVVTLEAVGGEDGGADTDAAGETELCEGVRYNVSAAVFNTSTACNYVSADNPRKFWVAMALSVFFGPLGFDRFYLGYHALGLAKLCTFGFLCLGWLADVVLIALQIVTPADGTDYYQGYYDTRFTARYGPGGGGPGDVYAEHKCPS